MAKCIRICLVLGKNRTPFKNLNMTEIEVLRAKNVIKALELTKHILNTSEEVKRMKRSGESDYGCIAYLIWKLGENLKDNQKDDV